jgi:endo-1,4-beta-xylanase
MQRRTLLKSAAVIAAHTALRAAETPLRTHAADRGRLYGAAAANGPLQRDPDYAAHFASECGILVPENVLKWALVHPAPDRFDFAPADVLAEFAAKHDMKMRGHTLVWHEQLAQWFASTVTKENARSYLENHIREVMGHYRGRMHSWDVVNEAIHPPDGRLDGLRKTPWLDLLGPEYLEIAYTVAAETDPGALLVYNDFGLDYDTAAQQAKRDAVLGLLRSLRKRKIPVQAFGMQAHLTAAEQPQFKPDTLRRFFGEIASMGLKILITEMDVADNSLPADIPDRDQAVAEIYGQYLNAALSEGAVVAVLTWGLTDKYTWLAQRKRRADGLPVRPLPLDAAYQPKPAREAIARAFDRAEKAH